MTNGNDPRTDKNQRREAARVKARVLRESQKKKERRNRVLIQGGIGVALLAVVAIVALVIANSVRPAGPGPENMASDGIVIGKDMAVETTPALSAGAKPIATEPDTSGNVANIRVYYDYLCAYCSDFESTNSTQMETWLKSGAATVEMHPISPLEGKSLGTKYSTRAANAAACVANYSPDAFWVFNNEMFADQPKEGTSGLSDAEITKLIKKSGAGSMKQIESCVKDQEFKTWVNASTDRALNDSIPNSDLKGLRSFPTVLVNGKKYSGSLDDPKEFASFVIQAAGETYSTATPTPTPTETPAG